MCVCVCACVCVFMHTCARRASYGGFKANPWTPALTGLLSSTYLTPTQRTPKPRLMLWCVRESSSTLVTPWPDRPRHSAQWEQSQWKVFQDVAGFRGLAWWEVVCGWGLKVLRVNISQVLSFMLTTQSIRVIVSAPSSRMRMIGRRHRILLLL